MELSGTVLWGPSLEPREGTVTVTDGRIADFEEHSVESEDIVVPAFVNAHTHIGDSIAKEAGTGLSLEELVAPPDGLKHRLLRSASPEALVSGMRRTLQFMAAGGTGVCYDFREGDTQGVEQLRSATAPLEVEALAFARGSRAALEAGDGFGASGAADADFTEERAVARELEKPFGIHAGEADSRDIDPALDLDPDFLVHVVHPETAHLERIEAASVPVVVCPRSNLTTGVGVPPVEALADRTTLALGTDNVMLAAPSMFREMETLARLSDLTAAEILRMATVNGAAILGRPDGRLEVGRPARLFVLDGNGDNLAGTRDPVKAVVTRAGVADVDRVVLQ